jgi:23S rRNA (adenine2503-C2)-methyltransferase
MNVTKLRDSDTSDVCKYVFDFGTAVAETVLYGYPAYNKRTVICCSTQSGCPVGCRFCGAGDAFVRSLTAEEIIKQVEHTFNDNGIDPNVVERCQIMMMAQGEPLLNKNGVVGAIKYLHSKWPKAALLLSTSAPAIDYQWVRDLSVEVPTVGLQFSVHESTDQARDKLIPFKAKLNLQQIAKEGEKWFHVTGRQPFFNYCAHDANTSVEDADRLLALFDPRVWQSTVSVVCEKQEHVAAANDHQRNLALDFMSLMLERGYSSRCF